MARFPGNRQKTHGPDGSAALIKAIDLIRRPRRMSPGAGPRQLGVFERIRTMTEKRASLRSDRKARSSLSGFLRPLRRRIRSLSS